ncbi:MAG: 50S ribosomal protein L11 methyltransferase [Lentisphaerae bacterium]|nr:50S ribosomal protein L11 methyltransferase [Lentisphaerota bacterium]
MKEKLYCVKTFDKSENPELGEKILMDSGMVFSTWMDMKRRSIEYVVYADDLKKALETALDINRIREKFKNKIKLTKPVLDVLKKEDWAEAWKKHFKVQHVTKRVVIKPTWLKYKKKKGEVIVELDPGMSFGTGKHATTRFCLKMLDRVSKTSKRKGMSILDAGCGSGILSIAAVKLGFHPVTAFDIDPESVIIAKENLALNKLSREDAKIFEAELSELKPRIKFDVITANIISGVLIQNREKLSSMLKPDGYLILAGILKTDYRELRKSFREIGFREILSSSENEWTGGLFRKTAIGDQ